MPDFRLEPFSLYHTFQTCQDQPARLQAGFPEMLDVLQTMENHLYTVRFM